MISKYSNVSANQPFHLPFKLQYYKKCGTWCVKYQIEKIKTRNKLFTIAFKGFTGHK